ncbi:MAG: hypothetical protein NUK62_07995 [Tenericutes bacterium]|nr:hypothetical protein [Mycoplasmatota bacterium]
MLGRLEDVLDNIGPGVHDVRFYDRDGVRLRTLDLRKFDFDNIPVIKITDNALSVLDWNIKNIHLDVKKEIED